MSIDYRDYAETGDLAGQRELFRLSFPEVVGTSIETAEHYHWKFGGFPDVPSFHAYVGEEAGVQVGFYAAIPYRYQIDGVEKVAGMVCDVMTHPKWRGRGVFTQIGRYSLQRLAETGVAFTMGYPIRPEVLPGHLKVGWRVVQKMPMYARPVGISSVLPTWLRPLGRIVDPVMRGIQSLASVGCRGYRTVTYTRAGFLEHVAEGDGYAQFLAAWLAQQPNGLVKDAAFMAWRTGAPGTSYHMVCLHHGDELVGLAVVRPTPLKGVATLAVLDFMVLTPHQSASGALHLALLRLAASQRCDLIACMMTRAWAGRYRFARNIYLRTPYIFSLIVNRLDDGLSDAQLYDEARWHLGWIDSDDL